MDDEDPGDLREDGERFDLEVTRLRAPSTGATPVWTPLPARAARGVTRRAWRLALRFGLPLLALVLVVASLRALPSGITTATAPARAAGPATPGVPSLGPLLGPNPATIAPPPADCLTNPPPDTSSYLGAPAFGDSPLWLVGFDEVEPEPIVHFAGIYPRLWTFDGWQWRVLLVTDRRYAGPITIAVTNASGAASRFTLGQEPTTTVTLDTHQPASLLFGWGEWAAYVYLPAPGCYSLTASWPGGGWRVSFAAGR